MCVGAKFEPKIDCEIVPGNPTVLSFCSIIVLCCACEQPSTQSHYESEVKQALVEVAESIDDKSHVTSTDPATKGDSKKEKRKRLLIPSRLHKNHTLLLLAADPDARVLQLMNKFRDLLSEEQSDKAKAIICSYDDRFLELLRKRAEILENVGDGSDIDAKIIEVYEKTVKLAESIRNEIKQDVLTKQQRTLLAARHQEFLRQQKLKEEPANK